MKQSRWHLCVFSLLCLALPGMTLVHAASVHAAPSLSGPRLRAAYGKLPLYFEANRGQSDRRVHFLARGNGYRLFLTNNEAVLALSRIEDRGSKIAASDSWAAGRGSRSSILHPRSSSVLRLKLLDANPRPGVTGQAMLPGKVNYLHGNDPRRWQTNVPTYAKVHYRHVYPGIDLVFYGRQRQLEYDFEVAPGADPRRIALRFDGLAQE